MQWFRCASSLNAVTASSRVCMHWLCCAPSLNTETALSCVCMQWSKFVHSCRIFLVFHYSILSSLQPLPLLDFLPHICHSFSRSRSRRIKMWITMKTWKSLCIVLLWVFHLFFSSFFSSLPFSIFFLLGDGSFLLFSRLLRDFKGTFLNTKQNNFQKRFDRIS